MLNFDTFKPGLIGSLAAAAMIALPASAGAAELPGDGKTVNLARASWDTGWFQTEIYKQALQDLGYDVEGPTTLDNPPFYQALSQDDVDLWVNGWFPMHNQYEDTFEGKAEKVGYVAKGGALQGYLIDKKTAEEHGITCLLYTSPSPRDLSTSRMPSSA